jgi:hypothetical protein
MKSKILIMVLIICAINFTFGQEISKSDIVNFKIKSITTIDSDKNIKFVNFYNDKGNIIKQSSPADNKKLKTDREYFYDDSLKLIKEVSYNFKGDSNSIWKYFYNKKNQLIRKESTSSGEIDAFWTYEYDEKGNKLIEKQTSETIGNTSTKYKYDADNLIIWEEKLNKLIGKEEKVDYKYSVKKQLIEKKTKSYYFNTTITLTYLYDNKDKLIKLLEKSSNGVSSTTTFEYDKNGLLSSNIWESSLGKIPHKTTYQIKF